MKDTVLYRTKTIQSTKCCISPCSKTAIYSVYYYHYLLLTTRAAERRFWLSLWGRQAYMDGLTPIDACSVWRHEHQFLAGRDCSKQGRLQQAMADVQGCTRWRTSCWHWCTYGRRLCYVLQRQGRRHSSIYCCDASVRCATQDHDDHDGVERCNQRRSR